MNSVMIFLAVLISLQAIMTSPTHHHHHHIIHRSEHVVGSKDKVREKCYSYINTAGFPSISGGGYNLPFTQAYYITINQNFGFSACNSYFNQHTFGTCRFSQDCPGPYQRYTNGLLAGVGGLVGNVVGTVDNVVDGVVQTTDGVLGGVLGLLSDKELKENTNQV